MRKTHKNYSVFYSLAGLISIISLCLLYAAINYQHENKHKEINVQAKLLLTQNTLKNSLIKFNQYVSLTESRLLNAESHKNLIRDIISFKPNSFEGKDFPEIIKLEFTPISNPELRFSRFGEELISKEQALNKGNNAWTYLGEGKFFYQKELRNYPQKSIGRLECIVSFKEILYSEFSEKDLKILALKSLSQAPYSAQIKDIPFILSLNYEKISFIEYLSKIKFYLVSLFLLVSFSLLCGFGSGLLTYKKTLLKRKKQIGDYGKIVATLSQEREALKQESQLSSTLYHFKKESEKLKSNLYATLHFRYCQMASQAKSIQRIINQFIASQAESSKLFSETLKISNDTSTLLNCLGKGHLLPDTNETADILGIIEEIKTIFLPEIVEKNIDFKIHGNIECTPYIDPVILKACLFNVFQIILNRMRVNNTLEVCLCDESPLRIKFMDDGYDIKVKRSKFKDFSYNKNLLYMDQENLTDFIRYLGWQIIFTSDNKASNSIEISIPLNIKNRKLPENVVYLFKS